VATPHNFTPVASRLRWLEDRRWPGVSEFVESGAWPRAARLKSGAALEAAIEAAAKGADAPARRGPHKARASCVNYDAQCLSYDFPCRQADKGTTGRG
jgi:hypothetical protein